MTSAFATVLKAALPQVKTYTIYNTGDEEVNLRFWGMNITIPEYTRTWKNTRSQKTAIDADGDEIPGSMLVHDVWQQDDVGTRTHIWSADQAIRHFFQIDPHTGQPAGPYYARGLSLLPDKPSKDDIRKIFKEGRAKYETWLVEQARVVISAHDNANALRIRAGNPPQPSGEDYLRATLLLQTVSEVRRKDIEDRMKGIRPDPTLNDTDRERLRSVAEDTAKVTGEKAEDIFDTMLKDPKTPEMLRRLRLVQTREDDKQRVD